MKTVATRTEESIAVETEKEIEKETDSSSSVFYFTKEVLETSYFIPFFKNYKLSMNEIFSESEKITETEMFEQIQSTQPILINVFKNKFTEYKNSNNTK